MIDCSIRVSRPYIHLCKGGRGGGGHVPPPGSAPGVTCDTGALNHIYSVCVVFHYNWETRCCSVYNDDAYIYVRSVPRFLSDCMCNVNE